MTFEEFLLQVHPAAQILGVLFMGIVGCLVAYGIFVKRD